MSAAKVPCCTILQVLQFTKVTFGYSEDKILYRDIDFGVDLVRWIFNSRCIPFAVAVEPTVDQMCTRSMPLTIVIISSMAAMPRCAGLSHRAGGSQRRWQVDTAEADDGRLGTAGETLHVARVELTRGTETSAHDEGDS